MVKGDTQSWWGSTKVGQSTDFCDLSTASKTSLVRTPNWTATAFNASRRPKPLLLVKRQNSAARCAVAGGGRSALAAFRSGNITTEASPTAGGGSASHSDIGLTAKDSCNLVNSRPIATRRSPSSV